MKSIFLVFCLSFITVSIFCQTQIFTISNAADNNVTGTSPFQPIIPSADANLNITTLLNELLFQDVIINEALHFSFETSILEDVFYSTPFNLSITSNNNVLGYADLKNDSTGNITLSGLSSVVIGTELSWLLFYGLNPFPVFPPVLGIRPVEIGSLQGSTIVDGGVYAAVVSPIPGGMPTQLGRNKGSISASVTVLAGNYVVIQAGGPDSYAMVGFGSPGNTQDIDVDIYMNVEEGNVWVTGNDDNAFAQIGNRHGGSFLLAGDITVIARSVPVNVPQNGNTILQGGTGISSEARIGHVHRSTIINNDVSGAITSVDSSSLILRAGAGWMSDASVGHHSTCMDFSPAHGPIYVEGKLYGILLDATTMTGADPAHCQIGHSASGNLANCYDDIYVETHANISCFAGGGIDQFTRIGHFADPLSNGDVGGHIEINCGDSIVLRTNSGQNNYAHIGHAINPIIGAGIARGNILIRSGGRQLYSSLTSDDISSTVHIGHISPIFYDNVTLLAFNNIDIESSNTPGGMGEAKIMAWDTLRMTSADSIHVQSNSAEAILKAEATDAIVWLDAGKDISFESTMGSESAIISADARSIRCRAADDMRITQSFLETYNPNGTIWLESDKHYDPDSLYTVQIVRGGSSNPFPFGTLSSGNQPILSDLLGVIKFENQAMPTVVQTMDGNIDIRSRSTSVDGTVTNLTISGSSPLSMNSMTQYGSIYIGMEENAGVLIDLGDSYHDGIIEFWHFGSPGRLFFNVNHEIDVIDSEINLQEVLLKTN